MVARYAKDTISFNLYFSQRLSNIELDWNLKFSEEKSKNLAPKMFSSGLFMIHNSTRGCQHNIAKLSGRKKVVGPLLNVTDADIKAGRNDTALIQTPSKIDNNLSRSMVVNNL